jgi:ribokinase
VVNEGELAALAGPGTLVAQMSRLPVPCVVATLGARGCVARRGGELFLQPAFRIDAVDTTAAGDTFCGALAARLAQHAPLADALRFASAASALACTRLGAQASIPARDEVDAWLAAQVEAPDHKAALAAYCGITGSD